MKTDQEDAVSQQVQHDPTSLVSGLRDVLNSAIRGKEEVIELVLACLLARGHLLLEDLPGLGKTTLAKSLADALGGRYSRVQCTPDLMPSDVTGFNLFNQKTRSSSFPKGLFSRTFCWLTKSTARRPGLKALSSKRWLSPRLRSIARRIHCPKRSLSLRRKTRWIAMARIPYQKPSSIDLR